VYLFHDEVAFGIDQGYTANKHAVQAGGGKTITATAHVEVNSETFKLSQQTLAVPHAMLHQLVMHDT
jgi:hypothetical protein